MANPHGRYADRVSLAVSRDPPCAAIAIRPVALVRGVVIVFSDGGTRGACAGFRARNAGMKKAL